MAFRRFWLFRWLRFLAWTLKKQLTFFLPTAKAIRCKCLPGIRCFTFMKTGFQF
ncbi:hypothetical protein KR52_12810 [Synechococcus sp. KORDI-52]|nr:hypothetical protein KR52_12810 [Synechococcus sp. KORDI-52]